MIRVAVVGPGRAGRARIRDLGSALAAVVARQGEPTFDDVLRDPSIDAVAICTPNLLHAEQVRSVLQAGKHVLVEFPLAPDAAGACTLFGLARDQGRVLHVEHIELLSAGQQHLRERVKQIGRAVRGKLHFRANHDGWIADPGRAGSAALRAVARLHRLVDLFGPARVAGARVDETGRGYRLEVELGFGEGGSVTLVEERAPGLPRSTAWSIECERGRLEDPPALNEAGLFEQDLACFLRRVESGEAPYVTEERIVHVLDRVAEIEGSAP